MSTSQKTFYCAEGRVSTVKPPIKTKEQLHHAVTNEITKDTKLKNLCECLLKDVHSIVRYYSNNYNLESWTSYFNHQNYFFGEDNSHSLSVDEKQHFFRMFQKFHCFVMNTVKDNDEFIISKGYTEQTKMTQENIENIIGDYIFNNKDEVIAQLMMLKDVNIAIKL